MVSNLISGTLLTELTKLSNPMEEIKKIAVKNAKNWGSSLRLTLAKKSQRSNVDLIYI
jgi:hypothetical protein